MQTQSVLFLGVCILSFLCVISLPVSANQINEKCQEASSLINNITASTPRDNDGCVMKFRTKKGVCCLIGIKLNQREHFKGRFFIEKQCFKFKCLYGKKKKWEKCKCKKNKVKLPKRRSKPKPTTTRKPTTTKKPKPKPTTRKPKPTTKKPTPKPVTLKPIPTTQKPKPTTKNPIYGCHVPGSDVVYLPGMEIVELSTKCKSAYCSENSVIVYKEENCEVSSNPPKPTTQRPKPTTRKPKSTTKNPFYGCPVPGSDVIYPPGMEIPELKTQSGGKCKSAYCSENSVIIYKEEDCVLSGFPPKPPTTTKRPVTAPPLPPGCTAPGSGNFYPLGVEIAELKTRSGHRCVSAFCGKDGVIKYTEDDCFDPMDFTTQPLLGTTPPFHFTTLTPGEE